MRNDVKPHQDPILAVGVTRFGGPEVLELVTRPVPTPGPDEVVVRVVAAPVNPTDTLLRNGAKAASMTAPAPPYVAGMEFSGYIHARGNSALDVGQPVVGIVSPYRPEGGAQAQFIRVPAASVVPVAADMDLVAASTVPMNGLTAKIAIEELGLPRGSRVLVTGAAGAVGGYAVQLAKLAGLEVVADAHLADVDLVRSLGADHVVPRGDQMSREIEHACPGGVDGVVDAARIGLGAERVLRDGGTYVALRRVQDGDVDDRIRRRYVSVLTQALDTKALAWLVERVEQGELTPRVARTLPMSEAAHAHQLVEAGGSRGRVVLLLDSGGRHGGEVGGSRPEPSDEDPPSGRTTFAEMLRLLHFPGLVALVMVLPVVLIGPLAFDIRDDFTFTQSDIGTTFAAFFLTSALVSGFAGRLVERLGPDRVVRLGLIGAAGVSVALALSDSRFFLYGATLAGGALNGLTAVAISLTIMTHVVPHRRGLAFGLRTAGIPSAAAFAGLGAYLVAAGHIDWRHCLWVTAALACLAALSMRGSSRSHKHVGGKARKGEVYGSDRTLRLLGVSGLLGSCGTAAVTPFLVEGLIAQGQSPGRAASVLAVAGWFGIVSRILVGGLSDRVPDPLIHLRASAAFLVILAISMVCLAVGHGAFLLVGVTLMAFGLGLAWPGLLLFAALATHQAQASRAAGQMQFGQHSGAVIGPLCFGFLVANQSFAVAWIVTSVAVLVSAALLIAVARSLKGRASPT